MKESLISAVFSGLLCFTAMYFIMRYRLSELQKVVSKQKGLDNKIIMYQKNKIGFLENVLDFEHRIFPLFSLSILPMKVFFEALQELYQKTDRNAMFDDPDFRKAVNTGFGQMFSQRVHKVVQELRPRNGQYPELEYVLEMEKFFLSDLSPKKEWFLNFFGLTQEFFDEVVVQIGFSDLRLLTLMSDTDHKKHLDERQNGEKVFEIVSKDQRFKQAFIKRFKEKPKKHEYRILGLAAFQYLDLSYEYERNKIPQIKRIQDFYIYELGGNYASFIEASRIYFTRFLTNDYLTYLDIDFSCIHQNNLIESEKGVIVLNYRGDMVSDHRIPGNYGGYMVESKLVVKEFFQQN